MAEYSESQLRTILTRIAQTNLSNLYVFEGTVFCHNIGTGQFEPVADSSEEWYSAAVAYLTRIGLVLKGASSPAECFALRNPPQPEYPETFYFNDKAVGLLADPTLRTPGLWKYEPYRGSGHYELGIALRRGQSQECYLNAGYVRVWFTVVGIPDYGVLEVSRVWQ